MKRVTKRAAVLFLAAVLLTPTLGSAKEVKPPKVLEAVNPEYTAEARAAAVEGNVVLDLTVCEKGTVKEVEVVEPLSHGLTEAAVAAARKWKFEKGNDVVVRITMKFEL
jgi:TonB family protein